MPSDVAAAYQSGSQRARVVTEFWGESNLYCPNCSSPKLNRLVHNTKASDFSCPNCGFWYQLKGQKSRLGNRIVDGAYEAMMQAIRTDQTPNFLFMHYDLASWTIRNLLLVPHFAFPPSAIERRKALSPSARRAGWVGCNIALNHIPPDARIAIVSEQRVTPPEEVRARFQKVKPLQELSVEQRGWLLDVLNVVRKLGKKEFTNQDVYAFEAHFKSLHPDNYNIQAKIRQKLQELARGGFILHAGRNDWIMVATKPD